MGVFGWDSSEAVKASDAAAREVREVRVAARNGSPVGSGSHRPPEGEGRLTAAATKLVQRLLDVGIDGRGPFDSAHVVAERALRRSGGSADEAVRAIQRDHGRLGAVGGFVTGLGGFFTLPISLPANVVEFYLLGTRMTAAIAEVRGYDIDQPEIRSAVLLTLVGADKDDLLKKAGLHATGGRLAMMAFDRLPAPALMVLNKAVGFRLLGRIGHGALARLGRAVPVVGGAVGAALDVYLLSRIARQAAHEFPPVATFGR